MPLPGKMLVAGCLCQSNEPWPSMLGLFQGLLSNAGACCVMPAPAV
jgi:hypothetical protein